MSRVTPKIIVLPFQLRCRARLTSQRTSPSGLTMRYSCSTVASGDASSSSRAVRIFARSSGWMISSTHCVRWGVPRSGGQPLSSNIWAFHSPASVSGSRLQMPRPAASVAISRRKASSLASRWRSTCSVRSSATPRKASGVPSGARCTTRRVSTWRQLPSLRR